MLQTKIGLVKIKVGLMFYKNVSSEFVVYVKFYKCPLNFESCAESNESPSLTLLNFIKIKKVNIIVLQQPISPYNTITHRIEIAFLP